MQTLNDKIAIKRDPSSDTLYSGLIIAPKKTKQSDRGVVVSVGQGNHSSITGELIPNEAQVGDYVVFEPMGAEITRIAGEEFVIVTDRAVLAVIEKLTDESTD